DANVNESPSPATDTDCRTLTEKVSPKETVRTGGVVVTGVVGGEVGGGEVERGTVGAGTVVVDLGAVAAGDPASPHAAAASSETTAHDVAHRGSRAVTARSSAVECRWVT